MKLLMRDSVYGALVAAGVRVSVPDLPDLAYALPARGYIVGELADWLKSTLRTWSLDFTDDAWDCDNFSELARVAAQIAHKRTSNSDDALAFGVFEYMTPELTGHSICCAICAESPPELSFFEPQPNFSCLQEVVLSPKEIASCIRLRM